MARKKKGEINVDALDFKVILEEAVACSRLGRIIASYGATLTGREKQDAKFTYLLLKAGKPLPERTPTIASISKGKKKKKFGYEKSVKWFAEKYPKQAEALLAKIKEEYDSLETEVIYGIQKGRDLSDDYYIRVLVDILQIPEHEAGVIYHGTIKPQFGRMSEKEGLVKLVMEKGK